MFDKNQSSQSRSPEHDATIRFMFASPLEPVSLPIYVEANQRDNDVELTENNENDTSMPDEINYE